ncbi:MAG: hypothetical protein R8K49_02860 [Mariprofundaceae bacterium]
MPKIMIACLLVCLFMVVPQARATTLDDLQQMKQQMRLMQTKINKMEAALKIATEQKNIAASVVKPVLQPVTAVQSISHTRSDPNVFNPQISMILNGSYRGFSQDPARFKVPGFALGDASGLGDRGLGINESELNFAANVDHRFYASSTLSLPPSGGINIEEAYLQTLDLPAGLTLKGGRFFSGIGYINAFHPHHDDFIDRSLASRVFLNNIFAGDGVQLRWLAPMNRYLELGGELLRGTHYPGGGAARRGTGAWDLFAKTGGDVGFSHSWLAGLSWLSTQSVARSSFDNTGASTGVFDGTGHLLIADLVWKWAPEGNSVDRNFKFQMELFVNRDKGIFTNTLATAGLYSAHQSGGYAEAVYQFSHGWDIGLRHSLVAANHTGSAVVPGGVFDTLGMHPQRSSLVLGYANSEFSRFRVQLSHDKSQQKADNQVLLQYIMLIGAHGAHQF